jgi:ribosome maturation factor RimP
VGSRRRGAPNRAAKALQLAWCGNEWLNQPAPEITPANRDRQGERFPREPVSITQLVNRFQKPQCFHGWTKNHETSGRSRFSNGSKRTIISEGDLSMLSLKKLTANAVVAALVHLALINGGMRLQAKELPNPDVLKQRVEQFGVGTELKVKLSNGQDVRGLVQNVGDEAFVVALRDNGGLREVSYDDLRKVNYPKRGYKAEGHPDPAAARRMVVQLGIGEHIMVQTGPDTKLRGHIREIHDDHFVILPDHQNAAVQVPYNSILKVNKNLSLGGTIAVLVGIAAVVAVILILTNNEDEIGL